jgi:competence protein ComFC
MNQKYLFYLRAGLELVFPSSCLVCGSPLLTFSDLMKPLCELCEASLEHIEGPLCELCGRPLISEKRRCLRCRERGFAFDSAEAVFSYSGRAKELFRQYKFSSMKRAAPYFASILAPRLAEPRYSPIVVPAPYTLSKIKRKGWDQVELIARFLEKCEGIRVIRALSRAESLSQKNLGSKERQINLKGKIAIKPGIEIPAEVTFLDDVFTTGATADECARVLKDSGCTRVRVLTLMIDL